MMVRFTTARDDFPPNLDDLKLQHVSLYLARASGETFEVPVTSLSFTEQGATGKVDGGATSIDGLISTRKGNAGSWMAMLGKGQPIKDFLRRGAAERVYLEHLPGCAPELNPDESIWNDLKRVELANYCCRDLAELAVALRRAKERLRHKHAIVQACIRQAGYHI